MRHICMPDTLKLLILNKSNVLQKVLLTTEVRLSGIQMGIIHQRTDFETMIRYGDLKQVLPPSLSTGNCHITGLQRGKSYTLTQAHLGKSAAR